MRPAGDKSVARGHVNVGDMLSGLCPTKTRNGTVLLVLPPGKRGNAAQRRATLHMRKRSWPCSQAAGTQDNGPSMVEPFTRPA